MKYYKYLLSIVILYLISLSCASDRTYVPQKNDRDFKGDNDVLYRERVVVEKKPPPLNIAPMPFKPLSEDISPLNSRLVSISVSNSSLRDVLRVISEVANLNMVLERGVDPETPVTVTLNNIKTKDALEIILSSVDYFYSLKSNILTIKAMDTKIFELGLPVVINNYNIDVGGDILGGAITSGNEDDNDTNIRGMVSMKGKSDEEALKIWDSIDNTIANLLNLSKDKTSDNKQNSESNNNSQSQKPTYKGIPNIMDFYMPASDTTGNIPRETRTSPPVERPEPSYSINRLTGTIVVTATQKELEKVETFLNTIRESLNRQVLIEAKIVEIQLTDGLQYGINWNSTEFIDVGEANKLTIGMENFANLFTDDAQNLSIGLTGYRFDTLLKAIQTKGEVTILSNPRISLMNGQTALLSVGRNVRFISKVETIMDSDTNETTFTVETGNILSGIIFGISPYINRDGGIFLTITPIISDLVSIEDREIRGSGSDATMISLPTVDLREMSTTVKLRNTEMVVIGGLISDKEDIQDDQVPGLGDVPVLGHLFKSREKRKEKTELAVMIKPTIIK